MQEVKLQIEESNWYHNLNIIMYLFFLKYNELAIDNKICLDFTIYRVI